jgi:hypothetical protein
VPSELPGVFSYFIERVIPGGKKRQREAATKVFVLLCQKKLATQNGQQWNKTLDSLLVEYSFCGMVLCV